MFWHSHYHSDHRAGTKSPTETLLTPEVSGIYPATCNVTGFKVVGELSRDVTKTSSKNRTPVNFFKMLWCQQLRSRIAAWFDRSPTDGDSTTFTVL